ncbi:MAG: hypothetical protein ACM3SY_17250 [Candidatus Omnitrophota bacterium]
MKVCLTLDADWAPRDVVAFALQPLLDAGIPFTYFATDDYAGYPDGATELAWHPDFRARGLPQELETFSTLIPGARGLRPHGLVMPQTEHLEGLLNVYGIEWVSASFSPHRTEPEWSPASVLNFPINWGDNLWFRERILPPFERIRRASPGYFILNVHPIHLFLNTANLDQYTEAKADYQNVDRLRRHINTSETGVGDIFNDILKLRDCNAVYFMTLSQAWSDFSGAPLT